MLASVTGCGEHREDRTELHSAILLDDGRTAIIAFSHRSPVSERIGDPDQPGSLFHHAVLERYDLLSKHGQTLQVVDLGAERADDSFQIQQTRGDYVLCRAPNADRPGVGYALLDARSGALERFEVESELHSNGMEWVGAAILVHRDGWVLCPARAPQGDAMSSASDWWMRRPPSAWTLLARSTYNVCWDDEEIYFDDGEPDAEPGSWLAYRPSDHRRRRAGFDEMGALGERPGRGSLRSPWNDFGRPLDKALAVQLDLSIAERTPYLALRERRGAEFVERRLDVDLGSLLR